MSTPDDDLHGRQLALLLVFFGAVGGGLYFVGWLTRPSFFYDNPIACAAIAGGACVPAHWLVEQFSWWQRLEQPTRRTAARRDRARRRALAEAREAARLRRVQDVAADGSGRHSRAGRGRIGRLGVVRLVVGGVLVVGGLAIAPFGIVNSVHDQRVA
ncbi:hypothetical protein ACFWUU_07205 [Kribbella sp. NPDC058693]|uniref:hypothetical protein n=1 Tax=Kribbella sp. NPDC058693 TaxID=3346602 RepID=UPI00365A4A20